MAGSPNGGYDNFDSTQNGTRVCGRSPGGYSSKDRAGYGSKERAQGRTIVNSGTLAGGYGSGGTIAVSAGDSEDSGRVILSRLDGTEVPVEFEIGDTIKDLVLRAAAVLGTRAHLLELAREGQILDPKCAAADLCGTVVNVLIKAEASVETINEAFSFLDEDGSGAIDIRELMVGWTEILGEKPSNEQLRGFISRYDLDGSGTLNFEEFVAFMRADLESSDHEDLRRALESLHIVCE